MDGKKIQWHPGFVEAMILELAEDRDVLTFEREYSLNTKPLAVDLLVIKKEPAARVGNEVGAFFRGHNLVERRIPFRMQIVVTGELDKGAHTWLGALSGRLGKEDLRGLLERVRTLSGKEERELADSVLEVSIGANRQAIEELKGDDEMCQALMEIMEPQLLLREKEVMEKGIEKGLHRGIQGTVEVLRELGHPDPRIKDIIMEKYGLSTEEADEYF